MLFEANSIFVGSENQTIASMLLYESSGGFVATKVRVKGSPVVLLNLASCSNLEKVGWFNTGLSAKANLAR